MEIDNYLHKQRIKCITHEEETTHYICLKKNCGFQSRFLCLKCVIEDHSIHAKQSINIKDIETNKDPLKVVNWPIDKQNLGKILSIMQDDSNQENIILKVKEYFKQFRDSITDQINNFEKETLVKINETQFNYKKMQKQCKTDFQNLISLEKLKSICQKLARQEITVSETEILIQEYINEQNIKEEIQNLEKNLPQNCLGNIEQNLSQLQQFLQKDMDRYFSNFNIQKMQNKKNSSQFYFYKSDYLNRQLAKQYVSIEQNHRIEFLDNAYSERIIVYSDAFKRNQTLDMKFKMTYGPNSRGIKYGHEDYSIIIGVVPDGEHQGDCNWANNGNQIDIGQCLSSRRQFNTFQLYDDYSFAKLFDDKKQEIIINIQINIDKNVFFVFDEDKEITLKNEYEFEKNQSWRFMISNYSWYTPIFEIQQLSLK